MDWVHELISQELERFVTSEERLKRKLPRSRDYWQSQLDRGRISEREAEAFNGLLQSVSAHLEATQQLLQSIGWAYNALGISPATYRQLKERVRTLEEELGKRSKVPRWDTDREGLRHDMIQKAKQDWPELF